jgi:hypothetical protein
MTSPGTDPAYPRPRFEFFVPLPSGSGILVTVAVELVDAVGFAVTEGLVVAEELVVKEVEEIIEVVPEDVVLLVLVCVKDCVLEGVGLGGGGGFGLAEVLVIVAVELREVEPEVAVWELVVIEGFESVELAALVWTITSRAIARKNHRDARASIVEIEWQKSGERSQLGGYILVFVRAL